LHWKRAEQNLTLQYEAYASADEAHKTLLDGLRGMPVGYQPLADIGDEAYDIQTTTIVFRRGMMVIRVSGPREGPLEPTKNWNLFITRPILLPLVKMFAVEYDAYLSERDGPPLTQQ
jgi:hypothetical protein